MPGESALTPALLTLWESEEAIRRFAGEEIDRAVFYSEDERFLVERDAWLAAPARSC